MPELKSRLIELGYTDVLTYLNSGNVIFTAHENEESIFADTIRSMILERFDLDIPVFCHAAGRSGGFIGQSA